MRNRIALFFGEQRTLILMQRTIDFPLAGRATAAGLIGSVVISSVQIV